MQMDTIAANSASDMWAFGCIAYELLTGKEIFGAQYSDEEVMSMLIGYGVTFLKKNILLCLPLF